MENTDFRDFNYLVKFLCRKYPCCPRKKSERKKLYKEIVDAHMIYISNGGDINLVTNYPVSRKTLVFMAIEHRKYELAEILIEHGASLQIEGVTPLLRAISNRAPIDFIAYMLEKGANVNEKDDLGFFPLYDASIIGNKELVALLIKHGASINQLTKHRETCLIALVKSSHFSFGLFLYLIKHGVNIYAKDYFEKTIYEYAMKNVSLTKYNEIFKEISLKNYSYEEIKNRIISIEPQLSDLNFDIDYERKPVREYVFKDKDFDSLNTMKKLFARIALVLAILCIVMLFIFPMIKWDWYGTMCGDGWVSGSRGSGTCSWHGGIDYYMFEKNLLKECWWLILIVAIFSAISYGISHYVKEYIDKSKW